jgi:fluoride exporter
VTALLVLGLAGLGGLGAVGRHLLAATASARADTPFPIGTFAVNISGALALGLLSGLGVAGDALLLLGGGLLGSYTTFSTWMFESERLGEAGAPWWMAANLGVSLGAGVLAVALGRALGELL